MIKLEMDFSYHNLCVKIFIWSRELNEYLEIEAVFDIGHECYKRI